MALESKERPPSDMPDPRSSSSVVAALSVYVEPLVADARVAVLGDGELGLHEALLELGARTVHLFDPDPERVARMAEEVPRGVSVRMLRDDFDVRDGAFDLVVIPDVGLLPDAGATVVRLRRVIDGRGTVVAMGRARTESSDESLFPELMPSTIEYAELYDLFALHFDAVTMTGVLPFTGVVFAELGAGDDLAVSVDTRLVDPEPPGVFVVVASREEASELDPYAIVQIERPSSALSPPLVRGAPMAVTIRAVDGIREHELAAAFAAMQLKAEMLEQQLDEHRARLASADTRGVESVSRHERLALDRDVALARAAELEAVLLAAQQAFETIERRSFAAEQGLLERDDQIAALNAELDERIERDEAAPASEVESVAFAELTARVERAEHAVAQSRADVAHVAEAHAHETSSLEAQLRERARVISEMEKELHRREQLVRELVTSLDEARDSTGAPITFETAPALPGVAPEEVVRLRRKLDALALEVARREGELVAQTWRITELENDKARLAASAVTRRRAPAPVLTASDASNVSDASDRSAGRVDPGRASELERALATARNELDALRQALTQEHAARVAAESGEELSRARAELAHQAALLEQMRGREAHPEGLDRALPSGR